MQLHHYRVIFNKWGLIIPTFLSPIIILDIQGVMKALIFEKHNLKKSKQSDYFAYNQLIIIYFLFYTSFFHFLLNIHIFFCFCCLTLL